MKLKPTLVKCLFLGAARIHVAALVVWVLFALFRKETLELGDPWPWVFIGVHTYALAWAFGRIEGSRFGYLFTRGYSSDTLWLHKMIVSFLGAAVGMLPATLIVGASIRSFVQDHLLQNPYYPILASLDFKTVLTWWFGYAVFLPVFHYGWTRLAQPTEQSGAGGWLILAFLLTLFVALNIGLSGPPRVVRSLLVAGGLLSSVILYVGWRLHRDVEVSK
ncbi:MAG: hypothetical protein KC994_16425 [Candidatus Omnitrophica bacterium]|nr:hypothetical protein [Candidatus Omnitrophota bacterium]